MNEHDNLTPAEMESYRSALNEAYPQPKTDIHAGVMKAIRAERLLREKRARRAAFVKWGSVAACLAIVCLVGWKVIPGADRLAPMAENDSAAGFNLTKTYDAAPCDADSVDQVMEAADDSNGVAENSHLFSYEDQKPGQSYAGKSNDYSVQSVPNAVASANSDPEKDDSAETEETEAEEPEVVSK